MTWERLLRQVVFAVILFVLINFVDATRLPATDGLRRYLAFAFTTDWDYREALGQARVLASFTERLRLPAALNPLQPRRSTEPATPVPASPEASDAPTVVEQVRQSSVSAVPSAMTASPATKTHGTTSQTATPGATAPSVTAPASTSRPETPGRPQDPASRLQPTYAPESTPGLMMWPSAAAVVEPFGPRRHPILKIMGIHEGIDLAAPLGSRVAAAADGVVKRLVRNARAGRAVELEHAGGLSTFYAHLDSIAVQEGESIKRGEVIGLSGRSGLVTGPHLHFEVRRAGKPIDPRPFLPTR